MSSSVLNSTLPLSQHALDYIAKSRDNALKAFRVLRETRTISATGTINFIERIPGEDKLIHLDYNGPWGDLEDVKLTVVGFDGTVSIGNKGRGGWVKLFQQHPEITTVSHVHAPHLGAYALAHKALPFLYVPVQRHRFVRELPLYVDRRQPQVDFILEQLKREPELPGIVEANGGSTVWGKKGILALAEFILILEEGAYFQVLAAALGGSQPLGPGVLQQQWRFSGLIPQSATVDQDGTIHYAPASEPAAAEAAAARS
ncbi:MAG: class II aldolase/adducin family protein [Candidatus Methylacidiphilales bacterium]|nr:class II aldolase/adducin family protein [Candidatus Methylacidiphilales bacterium]